MAIYDLYDNSARPSPQPPASPVLEDARLELDSVLEHMAEDSARLRPEWRKRHNARAPLAPLAHKSGEGNLGKSSSPKEATQLPQVVAEVLVEDSSESEIETSEDENSRE
jgi:hypothetical protein